MAEAAALAGAALGAEAFEYNRQNYMYDRKQRLAKEFKELDFRIEQAGQWREDVRDIVGLQEKKSKTYCLMAVITLGFSMSLWCQGRLPIGTPTWVMLGNQVAAGGGFTFLTMVIWLGIYASVSAQGYETRLLTQLVRLPIPTWQEIESCRTYGSSFEKMEARQMFRVPFLMGSQEGLVTKGDSTSAAPSTNAPPSVGRKEGVCNPESFGAPTPPVSSARTATDPWGLEARRDDTYELGCPLGKDCAQLRHIKLARHAALFWQSYDAFARISLTIGINQVMVGLSYYILGQMCISLQAPFASFAGVFGLTCCAAAIAKLDIVLPPVKNFILNLLLVCGPAFACVACYQVSGQQGSTVAQHKHARFWACAAFLCHGLLSICLCLFVDVRESKAGDFVPTTFKSVLWLDAFGWIARTTDDDSEADVAGPDGAHLPSTAGMQKVKEAGAVTPRSRDPIQQADLIGYSAMDHKQPGELAGFPKRGEVGAVDGTVRNPNPALQTVSYNAQTGRSCPSRYEDFEPAGSAPDMRNMSGSPRIWDNLNAKAPASEFFNASSFVPRNRDPEDEMEDILTGHDKERPGILPWKVFRNATFLLGLVWMLAALYQVMDALGLVHFANCGIHDHRSIADEAPKIQAIPSPSLMQLWMSTMFDAHPGPAAEQLVMSLPILHMQPHGLSCDADARHFAITDGLSTFVADFKDSINFQEVMPCEGLLGEALDDTAITCSEGRHEQAASCEVLVLHRNGKRVLACPFGKEGSKGGSARAVEVSQQWLQSVDEVEQVAWLTGVSNCGSGSRTSLACASVGTTHGRIAYLRLSKGSLFPESVSPEDGQHSNTRYNLHMEGHPDSWKPGMVRAFNDRYLGILQPERSSIQVVDKSQDLAGAGMLMLPVQVPVGAFCVGGGHVYFLSEGPNLQMWRLPLPASLAA